MKFNQQGAIGFEEQGLFSTALTVCQLQAFWLRISQFPDLCFWCVIVCLFTSGFVVK